MDRRKFSPKKSTTKAPAKVKHDPALAPKKSVNTEADEETHSLGKGRKCNTESRGYARPHGSAPAKIVVDASEGFVPLWAKNTILRWRFHVRSMNYFDNPDAAKKAIRMLFAEAVMKWGKAAPVKFKEDNDVYDFEIVMRRADDCDSTGCTLAEAFFPDPGRNKLILYPFLFEQPRTEQIDTLIHEIGHVFGLRHFFAKIEEEEYASELFGKHSKFSIMNYGALSKLKKSDLDDLRKLYQLVWSGKLPKINGTPVKLIKAYHTIAYSEKDLGVFSPAAKKD
jgi:hypothetical protein